MSKEVKTDAQEQVEVATMAVLVVELAELRARVVKLEKTVADNTQGLVSLIAAAYRNTTWDGYHQWARTLVDTLQAESLALRITEIFANAGKTKGEPR